MIQNPKFLEIFGFCIVLHGIVFVCLHSRMFLVPNCFKLMSQTQLSWLPITLCVTNIPNSRLTFNSHQVICLVIYSFTCWSVNSLLLCSLQVPGPVPWIGDAVVDTAGICPAFRASWKQSSIGDSLHKSLKTGKRATTEDRECYAGVGWAGPENGQGRLPREDASKWEPKTWVAVTRL